jgi:hypothetical protein
LAGTVDRTRTGPGRNGRSSSSAIKTDEQRKHDTTAAAKSFRATDFFALVKKCEHVIRFIWAILRFMGAPF